MRNLIVKAAVVAASLVVFPSAALAAGPPGWAAHAPFRVKVLGYNPNGSPKYTASTPSGLSPSAINHVYGLSALASPNATTGTGQGQVIAIVDAYHDPNAASDLAKFDSQFGLPCNSCFRVADPYGVPSTNSGWALEESLDIQWAHAEAPQAKIVLVEAPSNSFTNLFNAVSYANSIGANEVSMSWGGGEFSSESSYDSYFTHQGTLYTVSAGDSGSPAEYPSASPNVISVGGTTLNGCSGTSCSGFSSETTWSSSGGGPSAYEPEPAYQSSYTGSVFNGLTGGQRSTPDVSFDANPNTGVSVFDSTRYNGQSGWFTLGGTSVGAPNWAGVLAAGGGSAGTGGLQTEPKVYSIGSTPPNLNLRDIKSGTNGTYGAGTGYDLVTGLGSPINYF